MKTFANHKYRYGYLCKNGLSCTGPYSASLEKILMDTVEHETTFTISIGHQFKQATGRAMKRKCCHCVEIVATGRIESFHFDTFRRNSAAPIHLCVLAILSIFSNLPTFGLAHDGQSCIFYLKAIRPESHECNDLSMLQTQMSHVIFSNFHTTLQ